MMQDVIPSYHPGIDPCMYISIYTYYILLPLLFYVYTPVLPSLPSICKNTVSLPSIHPSIHSSILSIATYSQQAVYLVRFPSNQDGHGGKPSDKQDGKNEG